MTAEIIVAILALVGTVVGSFGGIMAANKLSVYRIEQLEKKVDKHNTVIERVTVLENDNRAQWNKIEEIHEDIKMIKGKVIGG